jgi:catechol 2,3-dioxygenase-like lactoylglutathione lyase family enzyme
MRRRLPYVSLLIDDYDLAIDYFTRVFGFVVREDERLNEQKRWVVVAPSDEGGAFLLAKASTPEQRAMIGKQGGGRVWLFLHTDDFDRDYAHFRTHGVRFEGGSAYRVVRQGRGIRRSLG